MSNVQHILGDAKTSPVVITGHVPVIQNILKMKDWIAGTSPAMTTLVAFGACVKGEGVW